MISGQYQIANGNLGNQADLHAAPGLFGGKVLLQGLVLKAAYPPEKINFIRTDTQADTVLINSCSTAAAGEGFGDSLEVCSGGGVNLRQEVGALYLILCPGTLDIEGRHPQVAVVFQGQGNQLAQLWIDKELLPGNLGHRFLLRFAGLRLIGRSSGPSTRNRRDWLGIFRGHGAASAEGE